MVSTKLGCVHMRPCSKKMNSAYKIYGLYEHLCGAGLYSRVVFFFVVVSFSLYFSTSRLSEIIRAGTKNLQNRNRVRRMFFGFSSNVEAHARGLQKS